MAKGEWRGGGVVGGEVVLCGVFFGGVCWLFFFGGGYGSCDCGCSFWGGPRFWGMSFECPLDVLVVDR